MKKIIKVTKSEIFYNGISLTNLAKKYGTPLKVTFLDVIKERVLNLKHAFSKAIVDNKYNGKFIYANANKANYECAEIAEAVMNGDAIETSSYNDLILSKEILKENLMISKPIYVNGYKEKRYCDEIIKTCDEGFRIVAIIDSLDEYERYKVMHHNKALEIGLRVHLPSLYHEDGDIIKNDRFGLMKEEFDYIINDLPSQSNIFLSTIHFHQRGFDFDEEKFNENLEKAFSYYAKASQKCVTLNTFDIGGGTPLPVHDDFDYDYFANAIIKKIKKMADDLNIMHPNIVSENGKYSQKDSCVNIYQVVGRKCTDEIPWHLIDGSLLIAMPEMYALGEEILVKPINNLDKSQEKARLSSITCDCDDIYYEKDKGYMELPVLSNNENYIGIFGTGSYQNSMAGKGGIHHCLLPEETDLVVYEKNGEIVEKVRKQRQTIDDIKHLSHFSFKK